jgi:hypothetical protein
MYMSILTTLFSFIIPKFMTVVGYKYIWAVGLSLFAGCMFAAPFLETEKQGMIMLILLGIPFACT